MEKKHGKQLYLVKQEESLASSLCEYAAGRLIG